MTPFQGCLGLKGWRMPKGKVYVAALPICDQVPALREHALYVHHAVKTDEKWTVTEASTGFRIAGGSTRKIALEKARTVLLHVGNAGFLAALDQVRNRIRDLGLPERPASEIQYPAA